MNRFVPIAAVIAVFVLGNGRLSFAQIQILDGDGQQVAPNVIPADAVTPPSAEQVPEIEPQIFRGNGSSIIIRKSFRSVDENGDLKTETSGKAIVVGPDGKRQEFDLNEDENQPFNFGGMRIEGLMPNPATQVQTESFSLGVQCSNVPPAVASQLQLDTGVMVTQVPPGSPGASAGLQPYDILLYADEKQLNSLKHLAQATQAAGEADANISFTLIRGGKEMAIVAKPEKRSAGPMVGMPRFDLPEGMFGGDMFDDEMFGNGVEAKLQQQMEAMQERARRMHEQLENGMLEMPGPRPRVERLK